MFFFHLFKQIGNTNVERLAIQLQRRLDGCTNVVGVNVAVVQTFATYHHNAVAYFAPRRHKRTMLRIGNVQQEHHFVTQLRNIYCAIGTCAQRHRFQLLGTWPIYIIRFGQRIACNHMQRRINKQHEPCTTGINYACFFQHRQQLGCVGQRLAPRVARNTQHALQTSATRSRSNCSIGGFAHHRKNGSFNWLQHCFIRSHACALQRISKLCRACKPAINAAQLGNQPAHHLAQNHSAVSAGSH